MFPIQYYYQSFNQYSHYFPFQYPSHIENFIVLSNFQNCENGAQPQTTRYDKLNSTNYQQNLYFYPQNQAQSSKNTIQNHLNIQTSKMYSITYKCVEDSPKLSQLNKSSQNDGRNANSNLLRMFFRKLDQNFSSYIPIINCIIKKYKMKINSTKFQEWFEINKVQYKNYIRLPCVRKLFANKKGDKQHNKIMRILFKDFLNKDAHCFYLTSKKIKKSIMCYNFNSIRMILKEIIESSD